MHITSSAFRGFDARRRSERHTKASAKRSRLAAVAANGHSRTAHSWIVQTQLRKRRHWCSACMVVVVAVAVVVVVVAVPVSVVVAVAVVSVSVSVSVVVAVSVSVVVVVVVVVTSAAPVFVLL